MKAKRESYYYFVDSGNVFLALEDGKTPLSLQLRGGCVGSKYQIMEGYQPYCYILGRKLLEKLYGKI